MREEKATQRHVHELGSLEVLGRAPRNLTFLFGQVPHLVVRGRVKRRAAA